MWENKHGTPGYQIWKLNHNCKNNHTKFSRVIESAGAADNFGRSLLNYGLINKEYLGEGDTSLFNDVLQSNSYKNHNVTPIKLECIGDALKCLGTRLRNLVKPKKTLKNLYLDKLTNKCIDSMQNYYGMAIRNNIGNLYAMEKAICQSSFISLTYQIRLLLVKR